MNTVYGMHGSQSQGKSRKSMDEFLHVEDISTLQKLPAINTELRKVLDRATDRVQPGDSFVIQKIKNAWSRRWDA